MPRKYEGFFSEDKPVTQLVHEGSAVDIGNCPWGTQSYFSWAVGVPTKRKFLVARSNRVDTTAANVRYSAYQDITGDSEKIMFGFFHTDICPYKEGEVHYSGEPFVKNAKNGVVFGAHFHLVTRYPTFGTKVNPLPWLHIVPGGAMGILKKRINIIVNPMNLQPGTTVQVITSDKLNIRKTFDTSSEVVGQLDPGQQVVIGANTPQSPINDGYEWSPIKEGWIAVQVMATGAQWVKVISLPETCEQKVARLQEEVVKLKAETVKLSIEKAALEGTVAMQAKKLSTIAEIAS